MSRFSSSPAPSSNDDGALDGNHWADESISEWSLPIGRWMGTRLFLSYFVFLVAAVLFATVLTLHGQPGNADVFLSAKLGIAIWIFGCLLQVAATFCFAIIFGVSLDRITIGVLGTEFQPRAWSGRCSLALVAFVLTSMFAVAGLAIGIDQHIQRDQPSPMHVLRLPDLGSWRAASIFHAGGWLLCVQAIGQVYPMPRSAGRFAIVLLAAAVAKHQSRDRKALLARRFLVSFAIAIATASVAIFFSDFQAGYFRGGMIAALAIVLILSITYRDIDTILARLATGHTGAKRVTMRDGLVGRVRDWYVRQNARRALELERSEAIDAARLDDVLHRLHHDGPDSLSEDDKDVLRRVSENLQRHRRGKSGG